MQVFSEQPAMVYKTMLEQGLNIKKITRYSPGYFFKTLLAADLRFINRYGYYRFRRDLASDQLVYQFHGVHRYHDGSNNERQTESLHA